MKNPFTVNRRTFLRKSGATTASALLAAGGVSVLTIQPARAGHEPPLDATTLTQLSVTGKAAVSYSNDTSATVDWTPEAQFYYVDSSGTPHNRGTDGLSYIRMLPNDYQSRDIPRPNSGSQPAATHYKNISSTA